jgi:hypothetical protein
VVKFHFEVGLWSQQAIRTGIADMVAERSVKNETDMRVLFDPGDSCGFGAGLGTNWARLEDEGRLR